MSTKILVGMSSALLLTTSLLAYYNNTGCPMQGMGGPNQQSMQYKNMPQQARNNMQSFRFQQRQGFISNVMSLKLTQEQRIKIREIMQQNMQNMPRSAQAFSDTSFNKELYIKLQKEKRENMIQRRADMIERIYKLLDNSQRKELKTMMQNRMRMNMNQRSMMMQQ